MKYVTKLSLVVGLCTLLPALAQADAKTFQVKGAKAKFISDAPLETMVGTTDKVSGTLTVDPSDISKTTGKFKSRSSRSTRATIFATSTFRATVGSMQRTHRSFISRSPRSFSARRRAPSSKKAKTPRFR